jgi:alpha-1,6-mannosyltransferase
VPWVLPWTAIDHRRAFPHTTLVAGYHTDFPNAHVYRVSSELFGDFVARGLRKVSAGYAEATYREFDRVYTLGQDMRAMLTSYGVEHVDELALGSIRRCSTRSPRSRIARAAGSGRAGAAAGLCRAAG